MTANQINYAKLVEETRHNREVERYNDRMATVGEHNAVSNSINAAAAMSNAGTNAYNAAETNRHNLVTEQQGGINSVLNFLTNGIKAVAGAGLLIR